MAFSAVTNRGSTITETGSASSIAQSPSANLTANKVVFVFVATDNDSSSVSDGVSSMNTFCLDNINMLQAGIGAI